MLKISRIVMTMILITVMVRSSTFEANQKKNQVQRDSKSALPQVSNETDAETKTNSRAFQFAEFARFHQILWPI
jgi:hypothetical protein